MGKHRDFNMAGSGGDARRQRRRGRHAATTALGAGFSLSLLLAIEPAAAADECGPAASGQVVCTAAGNPYPNGISYAPPGDFSLTTTTDARVSGTLTVAGAGDVAVEHDGAIATAADGAAGLNLSGGNVAVSVAGSVSTSGAPTPDVFDADGNFVAAGMPATAVLVNAATGAAIVANSGSISTTGDGAAGINAIGATGVTVNSTGTIVTSGVGAFGVFVNSSGGFTGTISNVQANGGTNVGLSDGIDVFSAGQTSINVGSVSGTGNGLYVSASQGDISVDVGSATTKSLATSAISVTTSGGAIVAVVRDASAPILLNELGSFSVGTSLMASGTGSVNVETRGRIEGSVHLSSEDFATLKIDRTSTVDAVNLYVGGVSGGSIRNDGTIGSALRPTLVASVGVRPSVGDVLLPGSFIVTNTGVIFGSIKLAGADNTLINNGIITIIDTNQDSGSFASNIIALGSSGQNSLVNTGLIEFRSSSAYSSRLFPRSFSLAGATSVSNSGVMDLRSGVAGDELIIPGMRDASGTLTTPGSFSGSGGSTVYLDIDQSGSGSAISDSIIATGAIQGSTNVSFNVVGGAARLTPGILFAQGGVGTSPTAFNVIGLPANTALVNYGSRFDPATNSFYIVGAPGDALVRTARIGEGATQLWYRSADTVSSHFAEIRDAGFGGYAKGGGRLWGTMYGQTSRRKGDVATSSFGVSREVAAGYRQDTFGGQLGFDILGQDGGDGFAVGLTAGYQHSKLNASGAADVTRFNVANAGVLLGYRTGGLFADALGKFDYYWLRSRTPEADSSDRYTGKGYGGQVELGYRFGATGLYVEPVATIAYVRTNLDKTRLSGITIDFGTFQGLRGKAGARIGSRFALGGGATVVAYAQGNYVHEFKGEGAVRFEEDTVSTGLRNRALPDYGEGRIGFTAGSAGGVTGFVEGFGTAGRSYHGGGGRAGIRVPM